MLRDGPRCKVLGDEFFSAYWSDASTGNISDTIFEEEEEEKPTGRWHVRNTHVTQIGSSRVIKRMVPVDYSYQSKKRYQEPFLLLVQ